MAAKQAPAISSRTRRWVAFPLLFLGVVCVASPALAETVVNSVHNLSATGPGTIKATVKTDSCMFCHTAHHSNGATPLWNHSLSSVTNYIVYSSTTLDALGLKVPQPNGSSRLCLSCHDGTIALGSVNTRTTTITMQNGVTTMPAGHSNLGTDLSGDHPISFVYDSALAAKDPQIKDPLSLTGKVRLDGDKRMQCTSCHDPHNSEFGKFLVMDNTASALCISCHNIANWQVSVHATSGQVITPAPAPSASAKSSQVSIKTASVAANGCANCHVPHAAGGKQRLLKNAVPEQNCLPCHSGGKAATKNVAADFRKISAHPISQESKSHAPGENMVNPATRHVTCSDCHNPHATTSGPASRTATSGSLIGVRGVNASGALMANVEKDYELCFRCHADSQARGPARVRRQFSETNTRLEFLTTAASFHPVEAPGKNHNVPSLISPWTTSSVMSCLDCHNSDQNPANGGAGANGPHGSIYTPLLERQLVLTDFGPESPGNYALCYKCHDRQSILNDRSFRALNALGQDRGHRFHVVEQRAACTTCHDSHGVKDQERLVNFNRDYVTPGSNGRLEFSTLGTFGGTCSLTCHGADHNDKSYPNLLNPAAQKSPRALQKK
jgi:predicted CXXCH cytochrome family protein